VSATEAARNFSELMNRVKYRGESFIIERGGESVCELRPAAPAKFTGADLASLLKSLPPIDDEYLDVVEALARSTSMLPDSPWER
jgi:antitoxin (DNA-binding transcriptional repressor) of toxin-antitoxin stability system